jgi:hypothetical protein
MEKPIVFMFGLALGIGATIGVSEFDQRLDELSQANRPPAATAEAGETTTTTTLPGDQLTPTTNTIDTLPPTTTLGIEVSDTTNPNGYMIEYTASGVACRGILSTIVGDDGSPLKAMYKMTGDAGYIHMPPDLAVTFASEVMAADGVVVADINQAPPGTAFDFGADCIYLASGDPFNIAFEPQQ